MICAWTRDPSKKTGGLFGQECCVAAVCRRETAGFWPSGDKLDNAHLLHLSSALLPWSHHPVQPGPIREVEVMASGLVTAGISSGTTA
jgi:hypothetical protein